MRIRTTSFEKLRRSLAALGLVFIALSLAPAAPASFAQEKRVFAITVDSEIKAGTVQFIERSLKKAEAENAELFIVQLNTPGGLLNATEEISRLLLDSRIPTAVYVHKNGGWAFSAGTFILLSAQTAAAHPNASIGAAQPVELTGEEAGDKIRNASSVWIKTIAQTRGRDPELAEKFVMENLTLTGAEAAEKDMIDFTAETLADLLEKKGLSDARIVEEKENLLDSILSFLSLPYLVPLLLSFGALGIFFLFRTGEIESIGILGVLFLLLGLWGMGAINLSVLGVSLLALGTLLLAIEVLFAPGDFGILGFTGLAALLLGVLTFANEPFFPNFFTHPLFWGIIGIFAALGLFFAVAGRLSVKALRTPVKTGAEAMIGRTAAVLRDLDPVGTVQLDGELWTAQSASGERIEAGTQVRIVKLSGNTILVEKLDQISNN